MSGTPLAVLPGAARRSAVSGTATGTATGTAISVRGLLRDDVDARRYVRRTLWLTLATYAVLAAALGRLVSPWVLPLVVPLLYVRLSLALHELMHARNAARVSWFHRLAMIFDTPLGLGYREHRAIHLRHHRHAASAQDPELYQIRGSALGAFANALVSPERAALAWLHRHDVSPALRREALLRAASFCAVAAIDPAVFALYWATLRVCVGCASFVFHHVLHSRNGALGTFALPELPRAVPVLARLLFGAEPVAILAEHRMHHAWPAVRARDLARARRVLPA